ncbi:MAG: hypothetical protein GY782_04380 [Gammaproteobacteria bacterium]|nr:hypothetical protein [Gammaproteobacteria bacterium]
MLLAVWDASPHGVLMHRAPCLVPLGTVHVVHPAATGMPSALLESAAVPTPYYGTVWLH